MALTLVTPMTVEAKAKTPKLNKTKLTLTITEKKTKPTVQLKVKNAPKRAKWKTSNKKVATVSKKGKVTAKKKGTAIISVKVAKKTLKCKVVVKDTRKKNSNTTSHKHDYVKSSWFYPTCDLDGEAYYYCRICQDKYTVVTPATGHNYVEVSQGIESFTGKTMIKYQCAKCDKWHTQYPGPLIDYKKPHIHCNCGMDFNDTHEYDNHHMYATFNGDKGNHGSHNDLCCLV